MPQLLLYVLCLGLVVGVAWGEPNDNYTKPITCAGSDTGLGHTHSGKPRLRYDSYVAMFGNCTVVEKSVEIVFLEGPDDYDMSFLSSIREIRGYLLVYGNSFTSLPLTNLRLIRGRPSYDDYQRGMFSIYVSHNEKLRDVQLTSMHEILEGNVHIEANQSLCYLDTIDWKDIMSKTDSVFIETWDKCGECDSACENNGKKRCWSSGPEMCQKINKQKCSANCEFGCFGRGVTECCDASCAAGCLYSQKNCWACRHFNNSGSCVDRCPPEKIYNQKTYKSEANPEAKYAYGTDCIERCPSHMLVENGYCVTTCPEGHMPDEDNHCVLCENRLCPKKCNGTGEEGLHADNINDFINCTIIEGNLQIITHPFTGDKYYNRTALTMDQLFALESVQEITEFLYVDAESPNFTSLSFLRNLKVIHGRRLYKDLTYSLAIYGTSLVDLGLSSLREIKNGILMISKNTNLTRLGFVSFEFAHGMSAKATAIYIKSNPRLCHVDKFNFTGLFDPSKRIVVGDNAPASECESMNNTCSTQCTDDGCWGPGDDECRFCNDYRYDRLCLETCKDIPRLYEDGKRCYKCHDECLDTCHGNGSDNCTACLHVKDGPYCVATCPESKYPDKDGICRECHSNCRKGCTGPLGFLGEDGCNDCDVIIETTSECKPEAYECGNRYHKAQKRNVEVRMNNGTVFTKKMEVCRECDEQCRSCEGLGTREDICECLNYNHEKQCVQSCPPGYYGDKYKVCQKCHKECKRCVGPSDSNCTLCENYRIYWDDGELDPNKTAMNYDSDEESSDDELIARRRRSMIMPNANESDPFFHRSWPFTCNNSCPDWAPDHRTEGFKIEGLDDVQNQFICYVKPFSSGSTLDGGKEMETVGAVVGVVCFIGIVAVVVAVMVRQRARAEENKYRLEAKIQGLDDEEILTPTNAKPDMSSLRLIKESELLRGPEIGSGAFGTVYKGIWSPEGEHVKVPVAIKVLIEGSNPGLNKELLDEARVMASVVNPCCIRILAVCQTKQMMLITPLVLYGCLLDYIRKEKEKLNSSCMLRWSTQIARGMHYLEQKGIVHRDLAARNILVQSPNQIKITDFGLAKLLNYEEVQYLSTGGKMPIKWLALESIQHRIFTHKSDVWSYGVTLWELFTYGARPYEHIRAVNMADHLELGERLCQPSICTIDVYMIMIKCWMLDVDSRPTFKELETDFAAMARDPGRYLVIPGDKLMRTASCEPEENFEDLLRMIGSSVDESEKLITAEDYLNPQDMQSDHPLSTRYIRRLTSVMEEETSSPEYLNESCNGSQAENSLNESRELSHLKAAATARKDGRTRKPSLRYFANPCRDDDNVDNLKQAPSPPTSDDLKKGFDSGIDMSKNFMVNVDHDDYLEPRSSVPNKYLDVVAGDDADKQPSYLDMQSPAICLDNPEYLLGSPSKAGANKKCPPGSQSFYVNSNNSPSQRKKEPSNYYNDTPKEKQRVTIPYSKLNQADSYV